MAQMVLFATINDKKNCYVVMLLELQGNVKRRFTHLKIQFKPLSFLVKRRNKRLSLTMKSELLKTKCNGEL